MNLMVIACYRPKPGQDSALLALTKTHLPILRNEGLLGEGPVLCGRAKDGTLVEIFHWKSEAAIEAAHKNEAVLALWGRYEEVSDFVAIGDVAGANELFTGLMPVDLS